jgi:hypothetical protein
MQWKPGKDFFFTVPQPLVGQGLLIFEASWSHSDTHTHTHTHSVELLWTSDQPDVERLPDNTQHSQEKDIHAPARFEPIISASERPQTHAFDRAATGVARKDYIVYIFSRTPKNFEIFITFIYFPLSVTDSEQVWILKCMKAICQY